MGTTATALRAGSVRRGFVLAIEGFDYLLTDAKSVTPVLTAWAATDWTQALTGLKVGGPLRRRAQPWSREIDVATIAFAVQPDAADTFGKAVFKSKPTFSTRLTSTYEPASDGTGTMPVKDTAAWPSSGEVYVGGQRYTYGSKTGTTFEIDESNTFAPFTGDTGLNFSPPQRTPENVNWDAAPPQRVSDVPPTWIGRRVALYLHRVSGGVWDTRAQAELMFAGRITDVADSETGDTVLSCEDLSACISDAVILENQWTGYVKPGIRLVTGTRFQLQMIPLDLGGASVNSDELVVVASGATGTDEINAGYYSLDAFRSKLNAWAAGDASIIAEADVSFKIDTGAESGSRFRATFKYGTSEWRYAAFRSTSLYNLEFLGFANPKQLTIADRAWHQVGAATGQDDTQAEIVSDSAPYRVKFLQGSPGSSWRVTLTDVVAELDTSEGVFYDQRDYLPPVLKATTTPSEEWGIFQVGNMILLGRRDSATQISGLSRYVGPLKYVDSSDDPDNDGIAIDQDDDKLPIRQVLLLSGSFADVVTKLIASQGGTVGQQHADYDVFPWGAKIPWSLLGDNWVDSATSLEQASNSKSITALVLRPTPLVDILAPELAMRFAWVVWKDNGYQLRTLPTPNALTADHTLTEANKADPKDTKSSGKTTTLITNEWLRNVVKLEYARDATGRYRRVLTVKDRASISQFGESQAITIQAVNSFGYEATAGAAVEEMAGSIVSRVLPVFSKPLKTLQRSIAPTLFHMAPGDTVAVTDNFARDPTSGERSMSSRGAVVLSVSFDFGHGSGKLYGECELLFFDEDRHYPMAPVAEIDTSYSGTLDGITFTNGYAATAAGGPAIKLKSHAYSRTTSPTDVTRFAVNDLLRIFQLDGAAGMGWNKTVTAKDESDEYLEIDTDLAAPTYAGTSSERFRVQPREYSAVQANQKLFSFQADDADALIEDLAQPNTYGEGQWTPSSAPALTTLPVLPVTGEYWGDGMPFHPGLIQDAATLVNNLANYRTAPNVPMMLADPATGNIATDYSGVLFFPIFVGPEPPPGFVRYLKIAPFLKIDDAAGTVSVRVTSSRLPPSSPGGTLAWRGPKQQVVFTRTGSTAWAEATAQDLIPVRSNLAPMITFITIEAKSSNTLYTWSLRGLSRCYLGPLEVAP